VAEGHSLEEDVMHEDLRNLCELMGAEDRAYRRLLRLAWRQTRYLRRNDVLRLASNAVEWRHHLTAAGRARQARERCEREVLAARRLSGVAQLLQQMADPESRDGLVGAVHSLADTVARLCRQNELNRQLAAYCLDLVREETEIFQRGVLEDPAGRYGGDAVRANAPPGGVLVRQA
jgi:hypothetical protein